MTLSPLVLVIVGLAIAIALGAGRRQSRERDKQLQSLASSILTLRRLAGLQPHYRPLTARDDALWLARERYDEADKELSSLGFTVFDDRVEVQADGTTGGIARWFVDPSHTVCGWFGVVHNRVTGKNVPAMMLFSHSQHDTFVVTARSSASLHVALPPNLHRQFLPWDNGLASALERHRAFTQKVTAGDTLRHIGTIDDALGVMQALRDNTARWRKTQPADALLDADLRSVLGHRYTALHTGIRRHLAKADEGIMKA